MCGCVSSVYTWMCVDLCIDCEPVCVECRGCVELQCMRCVCGACVCGCVWGVWVCVCVGGCLWFVGICMGEFVCGSV